MAKGLGTMLIGRVGSRLAKEVALLKRRKTFRCWFFLNLAQALPDFTFGALRTILYRWAGYDFKPQSVILGKLILIGDSASPPRLVVGPGAVIAPNVTFGLDAPITIGRNVSVSPGATLYTATHAIGFGSQRMAPTPSHKPIFVADGVWIGMHSLILPGVTLGQGCVVSAGSVVVDDVECNTLVAGNPARVLQKLPFGNR